MRCFLKQKGCSFPKKSKNISFYYDFPGNLQVYDIKDSALEEIFERITQDILNETLAKW